MLVVDSLESLRPEAEGQAVANYRLVVSDSWGTSDLGISLEATESAVGSVVRFSGDVRDCDV